MKFALFCLALAASPAFAAPNSNAAPLFERAARVYGGARTLALDYRVTCDAPALQMEERGHIKWQPGFYAQDFTYARGQGHFAAATNANSANANSANANSANASGANASGANASGANANNAGTVYFTRTDGRSGRYNWSGFFGFWTSLPWPVPGHLESLLRGRKLFAGASKRLPARTIEGELCDGAALDLGKGRDKFRFWFARKDGTLRRESWQVVLPGTDQVIWVQTRYSHLQINAPLQHADFIAPAEADAPWVDPDSFEAN